MTYEEVNPDIWNPKTDGELIEGKLILIQNEIGVNESNLYSIETPTGVKNVWGSAVLDSRMSLVKVGDQIRITFKGLGEKKGGKNPPKIFKVEVDKN